MPAPLPAHAPTNRYLPNLTIPRLHAFPSLQGDQAKQEAAQQYASDKGVELDKGPGTD